MNYIERERQRSTVLQQEQEALQQEHLDWLHTQQLELAKQTELLSRQTELLSDIRRHTGFVYAMFLIWVVLAGIGLIVVLASSPFGSHA